MPRQMSRCPVAPCPQPCRLPEPSPRQRGRMSVKTHADTPLGRAALAARTGRPWLRVQTSDWWSRVLVAAGAQLRDDEPAPPAATTGPVNPEPPRVPLRTGAKGPLLREDVADLVARGARGGLRGADLRGAVMVGANLRVTDLETVNLSNADLRNAALIGANLTDATLTGTILTGATLSGANLTRANLTGARMIGATVTRANLTGAVLTGATMTRATLTRATLTGADLRNARLTGADLRKADLTGADLTGVDLTDAKLTHVTWSNQTIWPTRWVSAMRGRSEPLPDGRYRIQGSGSSEADVPVPQVPAS
ncbi:pentapeptide repeat-containing protein [Actinacidiphila acidipaludis]|nr:pentapeptide repeat-containing protein [Streptomyces acidipaludis]